jgi:hypothetical protein
VVLARERVPSTELSIMRIELRGAETYLPREELGRISDEDLLTLAEDVRAHTASALQCLNQDRREAPLRELSLLRSSVADLQQFCDEGA